MAGQTINVSILADTKKFSSAMKNLSKETGLSKLGSMAKTAAKGLAVASAAAVGLGVVLFKAGENAATSNARIAQVFESMGVLGDGAGAAATRVQELSNTMARGSGINQNVIKEGAAILGTFSNIASSADEVGGTFDRALGAATDLSAAGFGSVTSASQMLGKALQDPARGMTSLTRVGVTFTDAQRDQIKAMQAAGDTLGAQEMLLAAVETQVGGVAAATANASDKIRVGFSQIAERLGLVLMPAFEILTNFVLNKALPAIERHLVPAFERLSSWIQTTGVPALQAAARWLGDTLAPAAEQVGAMFEDKVLPALRAAGDYITGTVIPAVRSMAEWMNDNRDKLIAVGVAVGTFVAAFMAMNQVLTIVRALTAAVTAFNLILMANPIVLVTAAVAGLVAGLALFFTQTETGRALWEQVWPQIQAAAQVVSDWFTGTFLPALQAVWDAVLVAADAVIAWFTETAVPAFQAAWEMIRAAGEAFGEWLTANLLPVFEAFVDLGIAIWERMQQAWDAAWGAVQGIWEKVGAPIFTRIGKVIQALQPVWSAAWNQIKAVLTTVWNAIRTIVETALGVVRGVITAITAAIRGDWSGVWTAIKGIVSTVWNGIKSLVSTGINLVRTSISNALTIIRTLWTLAWDRLKSILSTAWDAIKRAVTVALGAVVSTIAGLPGRILSVLSGAGRVLYQTGIDLIQGLLNGVGNMAGKIGSWFLNKVPGWIRTPLKKALGINSPSKEFAGYGRNIVEGLILGLDQTKSQAQRAAEGLADAIGDGWSDPALEVSLNPGRAARTQAAMATFTQANTSASPSAAQEPQQVFYITANYPQAEPATRAAQRAGQAVMADVYG